ncbi:uncharacterized protein LOC117345046 isoform X2 [Pecten maximus]|uniref:uncharacterized protein LOC117345046 isoform X1 n=1 Tax=Pecten maximus TaxID=6579 RepID=UPI001458C048|nr:uncharacterized protein LOC117345046 isoform X1 [Pecten maximus]XP_033763877.1 uncharacterized protein LOC117345046 isoform X2 [Pecten maximus]
MSYKRGAAHAAAIQGNIDKVSRLDESGYPLDRQDELGETPLMKSILHDQKNIAKYLLGKIPHASLRVSNHKYVWNALHFMAYYARPWPDIWNTIIERAPECLNQIDVENRTPKQLLQHMTTNSEGHATLTKLLKEDAVHIAAVEGNLNIIKKLSECNFQLDGVDNFGETPLMEAIMYGHRNVAGFLIDKISPASVQVKNVKNNWNALHLMAKYGRTWPGIWDRIVKYAPQCLDEEDLEGRTPQELSTKTEEDKDYNLVNKCLAIDNVEELKRFYREGGSRLKNLITEGTRLIHAVNHDQEDVAMYLANIVPATTLTEKDSDQNNVLHCMALRGRPWNDVWRTISRKCPTHLYKKNVNDMTPLDLLIRNRDKSREHKRLFDCIIMKGDMTDQVNDYARDGDLDNLKKLFIKGHPLETRSRFGQTSLMFAILHDKESVALYLTEITSVYQSCQSDDLENNASHYLATFGRPWKEVWQMLSKKCPGILDQKDEDGMTPINLVIKNRDKSSEHRRLYELVIKNELPSFFNELESEVVVRYVRGLYEHAEETRNIKILFVGQKMVGKTCLVKQLFGEYIDRHNHHSTNVAELHIRRLLLDLQTSQRISGTSAKDILLERLRMVVNKIKEHNRPNDRVETKLKSYNAEKYTKSTDNGNADPGEAPDAPDKHDPPNAHDTLSWGNDKERPQAESELPTVNITSKQKEVIDLVLRKKASSLYKSKAFVTMYDFGGEEVFYNTHHSLMTSDSIYLLVFNAAMCLNDKEKKEGLESIVKWLQSIATYAVDIEESRKGTPPVLLIGSHMDLVGGSEAMKKEALANILGELRSVPGIPEIMETHIKGIFPIPHLNDSSTCKDVFLKIWRKIAEIAPLQSQWRKRIPGKWIALEFELLQKKDSRVKVITIEELAELNREMTLPLDGMASLKLFLRYLHLTGFMLCFDLESDNPIIVLEPQWVIDAFKCLITAIKFVSGLTCSERKLWEEFEETGRLPKEVLKILWGKHPEHKFLDHFHVLVAAMERLGLLVKPLPKDKDEQVNNYVVPSMLKTAGDAEIEIAEQILFKSTTVKSCTLCVQFKKRFIPQAIWDKFIAACIQRFQPFVIPDKPCFRYCHRGFVALAIDRLWNIMIHCSGNVMKLTLFKINGDSAVAPGRGNAIRLVLVDVLQQILIMNQQGHLKFDYYLHSHPIVRPSDEAVEADRLLQTSPLDCLQTDHGVGVQKTEPIHRQHYDVWFDVFTENHGQEVSGVDLQRRPTYREMGRIAKFIYEAHHMFFIELGLRDAEISQIRQTCGHLSFRSQVTKIFLSWSNPRLDVSLQQIVTAMETHGLDSTAMMTELEHIKDTNLIQGSRIPECHLRRIPQQEEVETIAAFVDTSYFNLFLELGLQPETIARFEMEHKLSSVKTLFIELLNVWAKESGDKATLNSVLVAMKECNMNVYAVTQELSDNL